MISYGSYSFPTPHPFAAIDDSSIFVEGVVDHFANKISIVGQITGLNLSSLTYAKKAMTDGLSNPYQALDIGGTVFDIALPIGITFDESGLTTVLPYSAEFEAYSSTDFSEYFGVSDPVDSWTYTEQQGRIVTASHTISAVGTNANGNDRLTNAKNYVESKSIGFSNISNFLSGDSAFLKSRSEQIDRQKGSYGITEEFVFSKSANPISTNGLVTANIKINYSKDNSLQGTVDGSIIGALGGSPVSTGDITPADATQLFLNAVVKTKSDYEEDIYGAIINGPTSFNYDVNEEANSINFSFEFSKPDEEGLTNVTHKQKASISATKDSNVIAVQVNGSITYRSAADILSSGNFNTGHRFDVVNSFLETGVNAYGFAIETLTDFCDEVDIYEDSPYLNPIPETFTITKDPFSSSIEYDYRFSNIEDFSSGQLTGLAFSISDELPIMVSGVQESVAGFSAQKLIDKKLGAISIQGSCNNTPEKLETLRQTLESIVKDKTCKIIDSSFSTGDSTISYAINTVYSR